MFMAILERQAISARHLLTALVTAGVILLAVHGARAQVSCEDCDSQCMTNCVCQPDGSCSGDAQPNGTGCDDGNPCTVNSHCQDGSCVGGDAAPNGTQCDDHNDCTTGDHCDGAGTCVGGGTKNDGDSCTQPGSGLCTGKCNVVVVPFDGTFAVCMPDCRDLCHFCDPNTGECTLNLCSSDPCSTGQCDSYGACIPGNEGGKCDDHDVCTSDDRCNSDGECAGTAGGTPGPTSTPTATPSVSGCIGDCNNDGVVAIDEIVTGIDIALGNADVSTCENFDANGDGLVTVDEILTAVYNALNGCPPPESTPTPSPTRTGAPPTSTPSGALPTSTPTRTPTGATVTPSPTTSPGGGTASIGTRAAGMITSTTSAFLVIPDLLSALLGHQPGAGSGSGATTIFSIPFNCDSGGGTVACDQSITGFPPSLGPPTYTVTLGPPTYPNCQVTGSTGTLTFNGTLTATGQAGDVCGTIPSKVTLSIPSLTVQTPTGTATFTNFSADVSLSCSAGSCSCRYDTVNLKPTGTITVAGTSTNSQVTFSAGSSITITVTGYYGTQCVPTIYDMVIDGDVTLTTDSNPPFAATYDAYTIHDNASSGTDMVKVSGDVSSDCFGDTVTFSTPTDIALGNPCPSAGVVDATASSNTYVITYSSSGVDVDGVHFDSCLAPRLFACPAG